MNKLICGVGGSKSYCLIAQRVTEKFDTKKKKFPQREARPLINSRKLLCILFTSSKANKSRNVLCCDNPKASDSVPTGATILNCSRLAAIRETERERVKK